MQFKQLQCFSAAKAFQGSLAVDAMSKFTDWSALEWWSVEFLSQSPNVAASNRFGFYSHLVVICCLHCHIILC